MAGRIPQEFIDELVSRVDIVELIDARVPLKKAGRDFTARCPFHDERTPSFTVSPAKQFYHCFGCGAHGTALGFLMDYERLPFREAVSELAGMVGMELPREAHGGQQSDDTAGLYRVLDEAAAFYRARLRESSRAIEYLKGRGITGETARTFGLGYAPAEWEALKRRFSADQQQLLERAGLTVRKEGRSDTYDRFRDRVVFPIRDLRGRVIAFGGRLLGEGGPKYLNSPETPVFHKGRELYGLYEVRQAPGRLTRLVVVEGYMDVLGLAEHGIRYAVATLGTATTADHLTRLFRIAPEVLFCFDGDAAGRDAAWRALENALPAMRGDREARFLFLPEGYDPDTLIREEGREAFERRLDDAVPLVEYFVRRLSEQADPATVDGRGRLIELARPYLDKLPQGGFRLALTEKLAERARVDPAQLTALTGSRERVPSGERPDGWAARRGRSRPLRVSPVRWALGLLLEDPQLAHRVSGELDRLRETELAGMELLTETIELIHHRPDLNTAGILEHWRTHEHGPHLAELAQQAWGSGEENRGAEFDETVRHLLAKQAEARLDELLNRERDGGELTDEERREMLRLLDERRGQHA